MFDCIGLGIISLDLLCKIDHYPAANSKNRITLLQRQGGGPVPTALATMAKLGMSCALISKLGHDETAETLIRELEFYQISTTCLIREEVETPLAIILSDQKEGGRTVFLHRTPENDLTAADIQGIKIPWPETAVLHLDGHENAAALHAARRAKENGARISLDIGSARPVSEELLHLADILIVSQDYFPELSSVEQAGDYCGELLKYNLILAGITFGKMGSYLVGKDTCVYQPAFPVTTMDSTGAGDVFHGAALYGFLHHFTTPELARFASACAAIKCGSMGGKSGIPGISQVRSFLAERGEEFAFLDAYL